MLKETIDSSISVELETQIDAESDLVLHEDLLRIIIIFPFNSG